MKRLRHVNGTKERRRHRQALRFRFANHGPVIIDGIDPQYRDEMFARLWGHYGKGSVWVEYRDMQPGESYTAMDLPADEVAA